MIAIGVTLVVAVSSFVVLASVVGFTFADIAGRCGEIPRGRSSGALTVDGLLYGSSQTAVLRNPSLELGETVASSGFVRSFDSVDGGTR